MYCERHRKCAKILTIRNYCIFEKLQNDPRVIYESICSGAFDIVLMTTEKIDFSMECNFKGYVLSGPRSDFIYNKVERNGKQLWDQAHQENV